MKENSIVVPEADQCSFCSYLAGMRPYTVFFRSEEVAILVTREQRGIPHLLVIPVRHVETILDLSDEEAAAVAVTTRDAARAIESACKPKGISIWQNNGVSSSQTVPHLHFHVAGTLPTGGTEWGKVPELSVDETDTIASKLRDHFRGGISH